MDDISCPNCCSNLYTQNQRGYVCIACGYKESIEREQFQVYYPRPQTEWQGSELKQWREQLEWERTEAKKEQAQCLEANKYRFSQEQRRILNKNYLRAKDFLARYSSDHNKRDLASAEQLAHDCLRYASFAKQVELLHELRDAIKAERL